MTTTKQERDRELWKAEQREKRRRRRVAALAVCDGIVLSSFIVAWWVGQWDSMGVSASVGLCVFAVLGILLRLCWREEGPVW